MLFYVCVFLFALTLSTGNQDVPQADVQIYPKNQTVAVGNVAFFVCTAVGNPNPQIEWQRYSGRIFSRRFIKLDIPGGSILRIEPVGQRDDNAVIKCLTRNGAGEPSTTIAVLNVLPEELLPRGFPEIISQIPAKAVERGRTALLQCHVHGDPRPTVTWLKNMVFLNMSNSRYSVVDDSLKIISAEEDDGGIYECLAENSIGSAMSLSMRLFVRARKVHPKFSIRPDPLYAVTSGTNLNITCIAIGAPMPLVKWQAGFAEIAQKSGAQIGKNTLILENITSSANYTCIATSMLGKVVSFTQVVVKERRVEPQLTPDHVHKIRPGCNESITCATVEDAVSSVEWSIGSTEVTPEDTEIIPVPDATGVELKIHPKDQTVAVGNKAFFVCTAVINPKSKIEWQRNSRRIFSRRFIKLDIPDGSILRIEHVRDHDSGTTFECVAENGAREPSIATAVLTVLQEESLPRGFPQIVSQAGAKAVERGRTALLQCRVHGNPRPTVSWLKNMVPLNMSISRYSIVDDSLQITDTEVDDGGRYECLAENSIGSAISSSIHLYIKDRRVRPKFLIRPRPLYEVTPGTNLNISCVAIGAPMPFVKWQAGSFEISQTSDAPIGINNLILENIRSAANYTCIASSVLGKVESFTEIIVKERSVEPQQPPDPVHKVKPSCNENITCATVGDSVSSMEWPTASADVTREDTEIIPVSDAPRAEVKIHPKSQTVAVGNPAFFVCTAFVHPKPKIDWQRNSRKLFPGRFIKLDIPEGSILRIEHVRESDRDIKCMAENGAGEPSTATAVLNVLQEEYLPRGFPEIVSQVGAKAAERGRTVLLQCQVHGNPGPTVTWLKNMVPLNMSSSRYSIVDDSLRITDTEVDDGGRYECLAENSIGSAISSSINLYVKERRVEPQLPPDPVHKVKPDCNDNITCATVGDSVSSVEWGTASTEVTPEDTEIIPVSDAPRAEVKIHPKSQRVAVGNKAFFVCTSVEDPKPKIKWQGISRRIFSGRFTKLNIPDGSVLRIEHVRERDGGTTFQCVAENGAGELSTATAVLTVLQAEFLPRGFPQIASQVPAKAIERGHSTLLQCQVQGNPRPAVTWLKNMVPLNMRSPRYSIVDDSLQISDAEVDDGGRYECLAQNSIGSAISSSIHLRVKDRRVYPKFAIRPHPFYEVTSGTNLNVTCVAIGAPMPFVKWRAGSDEISQMSDAPTGRNILILQNITSAANYTCIASSVLGKIESFTEIIVKVY